MCCQFQPNHHLPWPLTTGPKVTTEDHNRLWRLNRTFADLSNNHTVANVLEHKLSWWSIMSSEYKTAACPEPLDLGSEHAPVYPHPQINTFPYWSQCIKLGRVGGFFFKKKKLCTYFNWRLITLQYCSGFCHTLAWISHGCTCVPQPETPSRIPPHLSGSSQCTSPEHPDSCIEPGLEICFTYGNIHVSMLFSQIIPPLSSPTESKSLFFISESLLLSHI